PLRRRLPDLDDPIVDVDADGLPLAGQPLDVDAEPRADHDDAIAFRAHDEWMSRGPVRHTEPDLASFNARGTVLEPHHARPTEHRFDAPFQHQPPRPRRGRFVLSRG